MSLVSSKQRKRNKRWLCVDVPSIEELSSIPDEELATHILPKGFYLWFLMHHMRTMYAVLSENVRLTRGVLDYLYDYTRWGPNKIHTKLFLCTAYNRDGHCSNSFFCREVHCSLNTDTAMEARLYGVFSNANGCPTTADVKEGAPPVPPNVLLRHTLHSRWTSSLAYPTLPQGVTFRVALPNNPKPVEEYDSGRLFVTKVVREHYDRLLRNQPPTVTLQHCANFSRNGVCCFGQSCQFVHVVHYGERTEPDTSEDADSAAKTPSNDNSSPKGRSQNGKCASFSDNMASSSKTIRHKVHFSTLSSSNTSLSMPSPFQKGQSVSSGSCAPNNQVLLMLSSMVPPAQTPPPPPAQPQQPTLSQDNLNCFNAMRTPFFFLSSSDSPQQQQQQQQLLQQQQHQQLYTLMLPPQDNHVGGSPSLYVLPY